MTDAEKLHKLADELGEDGLEDTALALHGFAGQLAAMTKRAEEAMGALADIALSDDMTLRVARAKAKRIYDALIAARGKNG